MANNKKGFILYSDQKALFDQLPNEKAGELIKHIFQYVNDENPISEDLIINLAFTPIKQQFKRDLEKWETTREGRSKAGKASAEAKKKKKQQDLTKSTSVNKSQQVLTKSTVNDNVNVNVNVKENVIVKDIKTNIPAFEEFKIYALDKKKNICLVALKLKYDSWIINGWKNGNDKKIKNWKSTLLNTLPYLKESGSEKNKTFSEKVLGENHDEMLQFLKGQDINQDKKQLK